MDWSKFLTRKFVAATGTAVLMTAAWVASNWLHAAASSFGTLVTGLGAALTAYTAGNVAQDHVMTRKSPSSPDDPSGK